MQPIDHQLKINENYFPDWKVSHLFIGTFNPAGGDQVNYYYGRQRNRLWEILSNLFNTDFDPNSGEFIQLLQKYEIACVDMIDSVLVLKEDVSKVIGEGYKDSAIINKRVSRKYNTDAIINLSKLNPDMNIYSTWGKGSTLKEWKNEIVKLGDVIPLVSPSMVARVPKGTNKFDYMLSSWQNQISPKK